MTRDDLATPVAAAATTEVKLSPYDEEEPHIWVRLIEAQFAAATTLDSTCTVPVHILICNCK
jgi:hypothetical protein